MSFINYVVSSLKNIKDVKKTFFQSQLTAHEHSLSLNSENVADFIDSSEKDIQSLWNLSESKNRKYVKILAKRLNHIHGTNYSEEFWNKIFSIQLLNVITLLHEFYTYAKNFDPKKHICEILNEKSFKIFNDFNDLRKFIENSNLGQEQLFSIYINYKYSNLYAKFDYKDKDLTKGFFKRFKFDEFKQYLINKKYQIKHVIKKIKDFNLFNLRYRKSKIEVGIMGSFFKSIYFENLKKDSSGKIQKILIINLPQKKNVNFEMREKISKFSADMDEFDKFFFSSLKYLLPKYLIENFSLATKTFEMK